MTLARRLEHAGLELPPPPSVLGLYKPATRIDRLIYTSGQLPMRDGALWRVGAVGMDVTLEDATECARICALNALAAASTVCDPDDIDAALKLVGYVASAAGFTEQPSVVNGASEVLIAALGDSGRHAREAVGVAVLPLGAPVEVSLVLCLKENARSFG